MNADTESGPELPLPGLLRRIAAALYDSLLVIALLVIPTLITMAFRGGEPVPPGSALFQIFLLVTAGTFFVGFWVRGGQTLGMRSWRIRVIDQSGGTLSWRQGVLRFLIALLSIGLFGLGIWWAWFDRERRTLPDLVAGTRVIRVAKQ